MYHDVYFREKMFTKPVVSLENTCHVSRVSEAVVKSTFTGCWACSQILCPLHGNRVACYHKYLRDRNVDEITSYCTQP